MFKNILPIALAFLLFSCGNNSSVKNTRVKNSDELNTAIKNAIPGDKIILANGIWKDIQIEFKGTGTKENPITLKAETPGKVFIEGSSDLKIGGSFLEVSGLYFKNGYTPSKTIIDFKIDSRHIATNCKVSNCVIEEFTQPERFKYDHWIELWGRNNQIDHCYIKGKSNVGPTVMVFLKGNENINNYHKITNNYFGPRPRKGGPHGETIQIGDSGTSMAPAHVKVANNLFEKCDGEVEVISNKSNFNEYRNNIFLESEGSLVLRHGNYNIVDGNIFIGNNQSKYIGGIRVINTGHWITNNYFYKLQGSEFRSSLAVMNGIPKSPLNRYNQVTDVVVAYNTYVDCKTPWHFSVGANMDKSDVLPKTEIRSARPTRMIVANNLIFNHENGEYPIKNYDKVDGVLFKNNSINSDNKSEVQSSGISTKNMQVKELSNWLFVPTVNDTAVYNGFDFGTIKYDLFGSERAKENAIGAIIVPVDTTKIKIDKKLYGPNWFSNKKKSYIPKTMQASTTKELVENLKNANDRDSIELTSKSYKISEPLEVNKHITIFSKDKNHKAEITYNGSLNSPAFRMEPKGALILESVILKGNNEQDAFATLDKGMSKNYNLWIKDTEISNFKNVLKVSKGSFTDTLSVANSIIKNCENGIQLAKETDAKGDYNAEFVYITNSKFENVQQNVLNYYRGGYDESTIGGNLFLNNNTFTNCGKFEKSSILLQTRGIVNVEFENNTFLNNKPKAIVILWGAKGQHPVNNKIINSGKIEVQQDLKQKLMY